MDVNTHVAKNWCCTQFKVIRITNKWTINNFSYCPLETGEKFKSSLFCAGSKDKLKWCLRLNPKGTDEESKDFISIYLNLVSCSKTQVKAKFKFSLLNEKKEETKTMESQNVVGFAQGHEWGFKKFIRRDFLFYKANGLLPDDNLTIFCEVSIVTDYFNVSGISNSFKFDIPETRLSDDLGSLFENQNFTDVVLNVKGRKIFAHKSILAARSPVFAAMFDHEMEEKKQNRVEITDMDYEVFREMLRFIYTGKSSNLNKIDIDLLKAADKYDLGRLKLMCEQSISSNISIETADKILLLADMHSAKQLYENTIEFINTHANDVMKTQDRKTINIRQPQLFSKPSQLKAFIGTPNKRLKKS